MMIIPDEKLVKYISTDEEGNWIHDPQMPKELTEAFEEFVKQSKEAEDKLYGECIDQ